MQVPDLIDLALPVLFGGGGTSSKRVRKLTFKKTILTAIYSQSLTCVVRQRLLRELCPLASGAKFPFFRQLFVRPADFALFLLFLWSRNTWSHFSGPQKVLSGWNSGA